MVIYLVMKFVLISKFIIIYKYDLEWKEFDRDFFGIVDFGLVFIRRRVQDFRIVKLNFLGFRKSCSLIRMFIYFR